MKIGDIVTLRRTSPEIVARSNGMILKYVGKSALVTRVDGTPETAPFAIRFDDGWEIWASAAMLRK